MRQPETNMEVGKGKLLLRGRLFTCAFIEDGNRLKGCGAHGEAWAGLVLRELWFGRVYNLTLGWKRDSLKEQF